MSKAISKPKSKRGARRASSSEGRRKGGVRPFWEVALELAAKVPPEEWEKLPRDGSINHDHYLYGAPKVEE
jgi:hypothetical protein